VAATIVHLTPTVCEREDVWKILGAMLILREVMKCVGMWELEGGVSSPFPRTTIARRTSHDTECSLDVNGRL